jgi:metal-sulfur cluster biosynthetic enzyme
MPVSERDPSPAASGGSEIPASTSAAADANKTAGEPSVSEDQVRAVLRKVKDPDLNLNIVDLGLIYGVRVDGPKVNVDITLTSPGCPSGPEIMGSAEQQIKALPGVQDVQMNLVWAPFWTPDRIEPRVRAYLGM